MFSCFQYQGASNDQIYSSPQEAKSLIHRVINNMAVGMNRLRVFPTLHEPAINPTTNAIGAEFNAAHFIPRFRSPVQQDMFYCLRTVFLKARTKKQTEKMAESDNLPAVVVLLYRRMVLETVNKLTLIRGCS